MSEPLQFYGAVYEIETGRITRIVQTATQEILEQQPQPGEALIDGQPDARIKYVVDGEIVSRPSMDVPASLEISAPQNVTIPEGAFVKGFGVGSGIVTGGNITAVAPTTVEGYQIVIRAFPFLDHILTVRLPALERAKMNAIDTLQNAINTRVLKLKEGYHPFEREGFVEKTAQARSVIAGGSAVAADLLITELRFAGVNPTAATILALANQIDENARLVGKLPYVIAGLRKRADTVNDTATTTQGVAGALTRANNVFTQLEAFFQAKDVAGFESYISSVT